MIACNVIPLPTAQPRRETFEFEFFTILPALAGWQLHRDGQDDAWFARWDDALEAADLMAGAHHEATGIPTAVVVAMRDRDVAMVTAYR